MGRYRRHDTFQIGCWQTRHGSFWIAYSQIMDSWIPRWVSHHPVLFFRVPIGIRTARHRQRFWRRWLTCYTITRRSVESSIGLQSPPCSPLCICQVWLTIAVIFENGIGIKLQFDTIMAARTPRLMGSSPVLESLHRLHAVRWAPPLICVCVGLWCFPPPCVVLSWVITGAVTFGLTYSSRIYWDCTDGRGRLCS